MGAKLLSIHLHGERSAPMQTKKKAELVAAKGIAGDRYFGKGEHNEITLIEEEALLAAKRDYGVVIKAKDTRRNLVTRGVALNHLVGVRFFVGGAELVGVKLCEPCKHLAKLTDEKTREALVHRGGLRARILKGSVVDVGAAIVVATVI
jgi:MOSC domain-containing protein YiiM